MNARINRALLVTLSLAWAGMALAIGEGRPPGAEFYPEMTQDQVAEQQSHQDTMGEVGVVPEDTEVPAPTSGEAAPAAEGVVSGADQGRAAGTVRKAGAVKSAQGFPWWGLAAFAAVGAGGAFGLRHWVGKNVPDMPANVKPRW